MGYNQLRQLRDAIRFHALDVSADTDGREHMPGSVADWRRDASDLSFLLAIVHRIPTRPDLVQLFAQGCRVGNCIARILLQSLSDYPLNDRIRLESQSSLSD